MANKKPICPALLLSNKIELHLKLDKTPGYYLTKEDQEIIIDCLRFTSRYQDDLSAYVKGVHDADAIVGALWSDLFNKDLVKAAAADYFDKWRTRIRGLGSLQRQEK